MSKTTLIANSLILSLGSVLCLAIISVLIPRNFVPSPLISVVIGLILVFVLTVAFAVYLHRKFGSSVGENQKADSVLVNETWLLRN